ncbi:WxL domain-containing protein [Companilactobacillus sp. FL22-1]|uniref:WxL domain-containing protein n=1 Tax=Companilactobacillus sp. FL22-1 TaxID=3373892 RepID=UPI0037545C94
MKLSRNVLVGSLATTGMVLGLIAPSLTAQAATTSGKFVNGNLEQVKDEDVGGLGQEGTGLAIAYDAGDGKTVGTATAQSNANVNVVSGILTLDSVPDFGFGTAAAGSTVNLKSNEYDEKAEDSQGQGLLTVTESREAAPGFVMTLDATPLKDDSGANVAVAGTKALESLPATINADGSAGPNVISLGAGKYNTGAINASFTPDAKNEHLTVGGTPTGAAKASSKSYNSTITWTFKATPSTTPAEG